MIKYIKKVKIIIFKYNKISLKKGEKMRKLIIASNNKGKIEEIKNILKDFNFEVYSLKERGINIDVEETGKTFAENAYIKAKAIYDLNKEYCVLADDSGLMVDYLNGEPGVYSARYSGEHGNDKRNNEKLMEKLKNVPYEKRGAKFACALTLILESGKTVDSYGEVRGYILEKEQGESGFGYDPLFYVDEFKKTFAEISMDEKAKISHRGRALKELREKLSKEI